MKNLHRQLTVEEYAREDQANVHARCTPDHDTPSPNLVDPFQGDEGEDEVGSRDDEAYGCRVIESDLTE